MYIFAPHLPHFFQSVLPPGAHWSWALIIAMVEIYLFVFAVATGHYGVFMQLLYLNTSRLELELGLQSLQKRTYVSFWISKLLFRQQSWARFLHYSGEETANLLSSAQIGYNVRHCCEIQLRAIYYNLVYSLPAYLYKLLCLFVSISGSVACIKLLYKQPLVAGVCGYLGLVVAFVYIFLYDWGFRLPKMFSEYKAFILAKPGNISRLEYRILLARVKALGTVAVKMGSFHALERCSTPLFLHFVLTATGSIVIAFPS